MPVIFSHRDHLLPNFNLFFIDDLYKCLVHRCAAPCRLDNPKLVKTYEQFKSKGFVIVGVSLDSNKASWLKAIAQDKLPWENVCDLRGSDNRAAMIYGVTYMPSNFLIDEKGVVIAHDIRDDALNKKLQELLP